MSTHPAVPAPDRSAGDVVASIVGLVFSALVGLACSFMGLMLVLGSDSCGASSTCDDGRIATGVMFGVAAPVVLWIAALVAVIVRQARVKRSWWIPLLVIVLSVGAEVIAFVIVDSGVDPL